MICSTNEHKKKRAKALTQAEKGTKGEMNKNEEHTRFLRRFSSADESCDGVTVSANEGTIKNDGAKNELKSNDAEMKGETPSEKASKNALNDKGEKNTTKEVKDSKRHEDVDGIRGNVGRMIAAARDEYIREKLSLWNEEALRIKEKYPEFDIRLAVKDKKFLAMLRSGVELDTAFKALNFEKLMKKEVSDAVTAFLENIRARGLRPSENGLFTGGGITIGRGAGSLSKKERADIARRVENGERIML